MAASGLHQSVGDLTSEARTEADGRQRTQRIHPSASQLSLRIALTWIQPVAAAGITVNDARIEGGKLVVTGSAPARANR